MTRDKRSVPQQSPSFVWDGLETRAQDPGTAPGRDGAMVATEAETGAIGHDDRREHGTRRATGRALIAAAVLVPLAGGSYAVVAHSSGHEDTAVFTAGASQAPEAIGSAGPSAAAAGHGAGATSAPGSGSGSTSNSNPGTGGGSDVSQGSDPAGGTTPPSSSNTNTNMNTNGSTATGSPQAPTGTSSTAALNPQQTAAGTVTSKPPATNKPTKPSQPPATTSKPTTKPTAKPTATKSTPSHPTCATAWSPNISYTPGQVVSYEGDNYTATYYSTDAAPNAAISWDVWTSDGACSS